MTARAWISRITGPESGAGRARPGATPLGKLNRHFFSLQPNVPGQGIVSGYTLGFWAIVVLIGAATGFGGALLTLLLRFVEHTSWSYDSGQLLDAVTRSGPARRVVVLVCAGLIAGFGGLLVRRVRGSGAGEISEALWLGEGRLTFWRSQARGVLSIVIVAMGASLGREGAPQLAGAAVASTVSQRAKLPTWQRRLLVACGAGAGMAAVYNVPLGGALFAVEVLLGTLTLPVVLPALVTSAVGAAGAPLALPNRATYSIPTFGVTGSQIVWAVIIGPLAGLLAVGWVRTITVVNRRKPTGWGRAAAPVVIFTALGATAIAYPQLLGNGKDLVQQVFTNHLGVALLAVLLVLKPLMTAACLGSGAPGGLFTPTLTLGVLFGALLGHGWAALWPGAGIGSYAIIGGAAVLAASMQGPLSAVVLMLELTHTADGLIVPILLAVAEATIVSRVLGAPSIYSARIHSPGADGRAVRRIGPLQPPAPDASVSGAGQGLGPDRDAAGELAVRAPATVPVAPAPVFASRAGASQRHGRLGGDEVVEDQQLDERE
jgi:CIC family chloride channel protein